MLLHTISIKCILHKNIITEFSLFLTNLKMSFCRSFLNCVQTRRPIIQNTCILPCFFLLDSFFFLYQYPAHQPYTITACWHCDISTSSNFSDAPLYINYQLHHKLRQSQSLSIPIPISIRFLIRSQFRSDPG